MIAPLSTTRVRRLYERANTPIARKEIRSPKIAVTMFLLKKAP